MNLIELRAEIEKLYSCVQGICSNRCQTLETYEMIGFEHGAGMDVGRMHYRGRPGSIPGVIREGGGRKLFCSEEEACQEFLDALKCYANYWRSSHTTEPVLYWRYRAPHLFLNEGWRRIGRLTTTWYDKPGKQRQYWCFIRSRLVLSDKPVVCDDIEGYDAYRAEQERAALQIN